MNLYESSEDYLERILMLYEAKGMVRSIDIATEMGVTKPSVSFAMKKLRENGYIRMDADNLITLTESGMEIAQRIYTRHKILTRYLMKLGVDEETARADACKMEHDLSAASFEAMRRQLLSNEPE